MTRLNIITKYYNPITETYVELSRSFQIAFKWVSMETDDLIKHIELTSKLTKLFTDNNSTFFFT